MFKKYFSLNNLSTLLLYFSILAFTVAFNFTDNRSGGWYQQFLTNIGNRQISDIYFLDSLTGWSVTPYTGMNDTAYVLKTTNGGDNWNIANIRAGQFVGYNKVVFLNSVTGFVCGVSQSSGYKGLSKSTDGGSNWVSLNVPLPTLTINDMCILSEDTIWLTASESLTGGVYKTTNGGTSWTRQLNLGTLNPENIYMYNKDIGFISKVNTGAPYTRKTTDGGQSWFVVVNNEGFTDIYFTDSLTGWRANRYIKKTTDGGLSWLNQELPQGGYINLSSMIKLSVINKDTLWGVGGRIAFPNNQFRGILFHTTNSGKNWGYQLPDTSINIFQYVHSFFVNKLYGWDYSGVTGVHTESGGDTTYYTIIKQLSTISLGSFNLKQNYPNPFNPNTKIIFEMSKKGNVTINILDITGKDIETIVKSFLTPGKYETEFNGRNYPSGIYFYSLIVDGKIIDTKKMILLK